MTERTAGAAWPALVRPGPVIAALAAYCLVHLAVRLVLTETFSLDEAEQMQFAQELRMIYRFRHPPLITWLVWGTQAVFGLSRLAFFTLKYAIMFAGLVCYFLAARRMLADGSAAALATASLLATYQLGYFPHIDLMHTVLLTSCLAASWWLATRVFDRGATIDYALFGVSVGLGLLSKYIFGVFVLALALGVALTPGFRRRVRGPGIVLAAAIALLVVAPYGWVALSHDHSLVELGRTVTFAKEERAMLTAWAAGSRSIVAAALLFAMPAAALFVLLVPRALGAVTAASPHPPRLDYGRMLVLTMASALVMLWAGVLAIEAYEFKERWMHQALLPLPIYLMLLAGRRGDTCRAGLRRYAWALAACIVFFLVARPLHFHLGPRSCNACETYMPARALAAELRAAGFSGGTIVVDRHRVGGNLRYLFPASRVMEPGYPPEVFPAPTAGGQCLLVWKDGDVVPERMTSYLHRALAAATLDGGRRGRVEAPIAGAGGRRYGLEFLLLDPGRGACH